MAGPSIGTWVKVRNKSGRMTARVIPNKYGGGSYEQGQVITQSEFEKVKQQRAEEKGKEKKPENTMHSAMRKITGTEKQVKWATDIRENVLQSVEDAIQRTNQRIASLSEKNQDGSKSSRIEKFKKRINDLDDLKTVISNVENASDFIAGRKAQILDRLDDFAKQVAFRKNNSPQEWERLKEWLNGYPGSQMDARRGESFWHLTREGIERAFTPKQ